ncbi:MAG: fimbrillin family protein [Bacteroidales bacterium]|nr:fimbrillin family protein [Bacteroidales bacterium]MBQ9186187.1 fimbrillin family protein [Bacteroidales bacterium]
MRKFLSYLMLMAVVAASCSKNEVTTPDRRVPVFFNPPVIGQATKGYIESTEYPTTAEFHIWGYFTDAADVNPASAGDHGQEYLAGERCTYMQIDGAGPKYWLPHYTYDTDKTGYYYWKSGIGYITFQALSPYGLSGVSHDWVTGLAIDDFTIDETVASQKDILYTNYTSPQRNPYDETAGDLGPDKGVDICFKHALSAVRFQFRELKDYATEESSTIKIKKIELLNAYSNADFAENRATSALNTYSSSPAWTNINSEHDYVIYENATGVTLTWVAGEAVITDVLGNVFMSIPQNLDHSSEGLRQVSVRITYTINDGENNTVAASLAGLKAGITPIDSWEMGKRYTYVITVGLNKILFDPVITDWLTTADNYIMF